MKDPAIEFDTYVTQYNRWFNAPIRQKVQLPWQNIVQAVFGSEHFEHYTSRHIFETYPCFHERDDLSSTQKAAIALGSDCKRIGASLEQKLLYVRDEETKLEIAHSQTIVTEMYELMKGIYVDETLTTLLQKPRGSSIPLLVI